MPLLTLLMYGLVLAIHNPHKTTRYTCDHSMFVPYNQHSHQTTSTTLPPSPYSFHTANTTDQAEFGTQSLFNNVSLCEESETKLRGTQNFSKLLEDLPVMVMSNSRSNGFFSNEVRRKLKGVNEIVVGEQKRRQRYCPCTPSQIPTITCTYMYIRQKAALKVHQ